jgi:prophage antirepressor-like protein
MTNNSTAASNVIPFDFRGHSVRAVTIGGEPWFVASDICRVLDVTNTTQAMQALDDDERSMFNIGRQGEANIVNESGLYTLILRSRDAVKKGSKPHAFRKWVTAEVLPAIRKQGAYEDASGQMKPLVQAMIGTYGAQALSNVIRCRVAKLEASHQRSAVMKLSSALHARFSVPRIEQIPGDQMDAACNFVASYAIEGEYLPHERKSDRLNLSFPVEELARRRPGMLIEKAGERRWLDVMLDDLRDIRGEGTPCEEILWELESNGYEVEGALCELKTYRAKLREFQSWVSGMNVLFTEPKRYAVKLEGAA